jgi:hypothetical protein
MRNKVIKVRIWKSANLIFYLLASAIAAAWPTDSTAEFTVKDSIELSYIVDPASYANAVELRATQRTGVPIVSPDQRHFLVVTQRGILATNKLEATIWLFDQESIHQYLLNPSASTPQPSAVVTMRASSNTPVITDVRWLEDSSGIAFLGKDDHIFPQLFIYRLNQGATKEITSKGNYVVAYDIRGDTIAYATLDNDLQEKGQEPAEALLDITGRNIYSLLFPQSKREATENLNEWTIRVQPCTLHVQNKGKESPVTFASDNGPIRLFAPIFRLSPDAKYLIALVPVKKIPHSWLCYRPRFSDQTYRLNPDSGWTTADENPNKAEEYVLIDLSTGQTVPILNAPAGRGLGYSAPSMIIWSDNGRSVILSNTFLQTATSDPHGQCFSPALVEILLPQLETKVIVSLPQSQIESTDRPRVVSISANESGTVIRLHCSDGPEAAEHLCRQFVRSERGWTASPLPERSPALSESELSVTEDLNHPPVVVSRLSGSNRAFVWDPNPQLAQFELGRAFVYHWKDRNSVSWAGILAIPPGCGIHGRCPLVIQTHGYDAHRFFSDGEFTTGSGGRAFNSRNIVVLQIDEPMRYFRTPRDGPLQLAGFQSAINGLAASGTVDPKRVGIIGFSFTCFHVLYALTRAPRLFAAAATTDGNEMTYLQYLTATDYRNGSAKGFQSLLERTNGGSPFGPGLLRWFQNAPSFRLQMVRTPLLMSALKTEEHLGQWEIYAALRTLRKPVSMQWLMNANVPHILVKPRDRYLSQQMAVDWFDFWLNGHQDSDPGKSDQYARWRQLGQ